MPSETRQAHQKLRTGFTTGTAAAAATAGAIRILLDGTSPQSVSVMLLTGDPIAIDVHSCIVLGKRSAVCTIIKDAGDDPDVTHRAEIGAVVTMGQLSSTFQDRCEVIIKGGEGVGTVTKPGLDVSPGEPAINPGPRKMIRQTVEAILSEHNLSLPVEVEIFVPQGVRLSRKTLNERLGILGGISILGTTGLVKPMSHGAYIATIDAAISVAVATGNQEVIFTTGRRSERFAQKKWPEMPQEAFIQMGDFFQHALSTATRFGLKRITLAVFFGKAVKMSLGFPHTHAAKSRLTLNRLSEWASDITGNERLSQNILKANTARHALEFLWPDRSDVICRVGEELVRFAKQFAGQGPHIRGVVFYYDGEVIFDSK
jgi:cobalt-precorrin-5B (C1)-methyltransferase